MGKFTGKFQLELISRNTYLYIPLKEPLQYVSNNNTVFLLDEYFETDLASVPRFLWSIPNFSTGDFPRSALVHDWLFQLHDLGKEKLNFFQTNALLYEMIRAEGGNKLTAYMYQQACNVFGICIWDRK